MVRSEAVRVRMIGEHADYAAFRDPATSTRLHHARQFGFQRLEAVDAATHLAQMRARDHVDLGAGPIRII